MGRRLVFQEYERKLFKLKRKWHQTHKKTQRDCVVIIENYVNINFLFTLLTDLEIVQLENDDVLKV